MKNRMLLLFMPILAIWCTGCAMTPVDPSGAQMEVAKRHFLAGEEAYRIEDYETSVEEYAKAVEVKNDYAAAYFKRGNVLYRIGRSREAIADFTRAASCFPSYRNAFFNRGEVYRAMGKMRAALRDYHRVQQIDPEYGPVYKRIGYILDHHFEQEDIKALSYYQRGLALNGPDEQVELWVQKIQEEEATRRQLEQAEIQTKLSSEKEEGAPKQSGNLPEKELQKEEEAYRERLEFLRGILREKLRDNQEQPPGPDREVATPQGSPTGKNPEKPQSSGPPLDPPIDSGGTSGS